MSKGTNCVIIYSVVLVILFIIFCYLMTIVNPEPLKVERSDDGLTDAEVKLENIIFDEVLLPPADNAMYGLEKAYTESRNRRVKTKPYRRMPIMPKIIRNSSALFNFTTQRVKPPSWARTSDLKNLTKHSTYKISNVVTRTAGATLPLTTDASTTPEYTSTDETESTATTEVTETTTITTDTPMKGRRRSIRDFGEYTNESVILHISDDSGQLKIEIKLGSNGLLRRKNEDLKQETESTFRIEIEKNNGEPLNIGKLARNSAIQVLPNNTLIIDEFEDDKSINEIDIQNSTADTDVKATTYIGMTRTSLDITTERAADNIDTLLKLQNEINTTQATPFTEVYALKVLFDNETKSITNTINHDEFHKITIKDILNDNVNYTESYSNNTAAYDVNNNSVTIEKPYNYQDFITVL